MTNRVRFRRLACVPYAVLFGDERPGDEGGTIIAVESYAGSVPTFTWQSAHGHLFAYLAPGDLWSLPPDEGEVRSPQVDFLCPPGPIVAHDFGFEGGGWGEIGGVAARFRRVLLSVDWTEGNQLAHLCVDEADRLIWIRNAHFQLGGEKLRLPKAWKKRDVHHGLGPRP